MAEVDGYWGEGYYGGGYWGEGYWGEYGVAAEPSPPAPQIISGGPAQPFKPQFPLTLGLTLEGKLEWVIPIKLKKEN